MHRSHLTVRLATTLVAVSIGLTASGAEAGGRPYAGGAYRGSGSPGWNRSYGSSSWGTYPVRNHHYYVYAPPLFGGFGWGYPYGASPYGYGSVGGYGYSPYGAPGYVYTPAPAYAAPAPAYVDPNANPVLRGTLQENQARWGSDLPAREIRPRARLRVSTLEQRAKSLRAQAQGDFWFKKLQFLNAYERYKYAVSLASDRPEPYLRTAYALAAIGNYDSAVRYFKQGIEINPQWPSQGERLDELFGENNRLAVLSLYERVSAWIREDIRDPDRLFLMGVLLHFDGDQRAHEFFENAFRLAGSGDHLLAFLQPVRQPGNAPVQPEQAQPFPAQPGQAQPFPAQPEQAQRGQAQPFCAQQFPGQPGAAQPFRAQQRPARPRGPQPGVRPELGQPRRSLPDQDQPAVDPRGPSDGPPPPPAMEPPIPSDAQSGNLPQPVPDRKQPGAGVGTFSAPPRTPQPPKPPQLFVVPRRGTPGPSQSTDPNARPADRAPDSATPYSPAPYPPSPFTRSKPVPPQPVPSLPAPKQNPPAQGAPPRPAVKPPAATQPPSAPSGTPSAKPTSPAIPLPPLPTDATKKSSAPPDGPVLIPPSANPESDTAESP